MQTEQTKQVTQGTQGTQIPQIRTVSHTLVGGDPAGLALALAVARELHAPAPRAPETATARAPRGTARRSGATARTRRTVRG
ncbi:hypothetical protein ACIRL0_22900 [Streptomyces sp. NPDC102365]|uniref:hypothetical protein n=1 Tax=Streptomyces sp. NPDC102365 TaxID=3366162 RepID=UPI003812AE9A